MSTLITNGVKISVLTRFQQEIEEDEFVRYLFAYKISIANHNDFPIKLLSRYWKIFDSAGHTSIVEGQGVIGEMPIIYPNQAYEYISGCDLLSDLGSMEGHYQFKNLLTEELFEVEIPKFILSSLEKMN